MGQGNHSNMAYRRDARGGPAAPVMELPKRGKPMTRTEAQERFRKLVAKNGLHWARVPSADWIELAAINTLLDEQGRREALGMMVRTKSLQE